MSIKFANNHKLGFSLFELLMTIAILGIMGSIAVAGLGNQTDAVKNTRDQRNAQAIAVTYTTARAAGLNFITGGQIDMAIRKIIHGAAPTSGAFKNRVFKVNLIGEADIPGAMRFLEIKNGELLIRHES